MIIIYTELETGDDVFLAYFSFCIDAYVCIGCGGTLYGDHGSFTSPNFPGTYPNSSHCEWSITAPRGRVVTVTFAQIYIDDPGSCQNNYLKLYNGPDASSQPVGPYCGVVGILPIGWSVSECSYSSRSKTLLHFYVK